MGIEPDRIELAIVIERDQQTVWNAASEPGWFVNEGSLVEHEVTWDGAVARVVDPDHGDFAFTQVERDEPTAIAFSSDDGDGNTRVVRFDLAAADGGTVLRVVESGFSSGAGSPGDRVGQHTQNTHTWLDQLALLKDKLEQ